MLNRGVKEGQVAMQDDTSIFGLIQVEFEMARWGVEVTHVTVLPLLNKTEAWLIC